MLTFKKLNFIYTCLVLFLLQAGCVSPVKEGSTKEYYLSKVDSHYIYKGKEGLGPLPKSTAADSVTTFFLVRHAEKESGEDPVLTVDGQLRAQRLATILKDAGIEKVYSTDYMRTTMTAEPVVLSLGLNLLVYDPNNLEEFVREIAYREKGKRMLIVGHSNTTPELLNLLTGKTVYENIPEDEYDRIYIVSIDQKGKAEVLLFRY